MFIIYSTFPSKEKAVEVGRKLLEDKLIGCFNAFPIVSGYWWKGEIVEDEEVGVIFKTSEKNVENVFKRLEDLHPYDTPAILCVRIDRVSKKYERWIEEVVG